MFAVFAMATPSMFDLWNPLAATPAMSHGISDTNLTVSKTTTIRISAWVSDKDSYQLTIAPNTVAERAGLESDLSLVWDRDAVPAGQARSQSYDSATGKLEVTYTSVPPTGGWPDLTDSGEAYSYEFKVKGVDNTDVPIRKDSDTGWSSVMVTYQYRPIKTPLED